MTFILYYVCVGLMLKVENLRGDDMILDVDERTWNNFIAVTTITAGRKQLTEKYMHRQLAAYNGSLVLNAVACAEYRYHIQFDTDADYNFFMSRFA